MSVHWLSVELKTLRKESPLSRQALASLTGSSASTISNFEEGKTQVGFKTVEKWFRELGYEFDLHEIEKK